MAKPTPALDAVVRAGLEFSVREEAKREPTNAANRAKTAFRKTFVHWLKADNIHPKVKLRIGKKIFVYGVSHKEGITGKQWLDLYNAEEITEQQFVAAISVSKELAKNVLGGDRATLMAVEIIGTDDDVRTDETLKELPKVPYEIIEPQKAGKASGPAIKKKRRLKVGSR